MLEKGYLIELSNNVQYIVMDQIQFKGKIYIYLIKKDQSGIAICELIDDKVILVNEEQLFFELLEIFAKNLEEK